MKNRREERRLLREEGLPIERMRIIDTAETLDLQSKEFLGCHVSVSGCGSSKEQTLDLSLVREFVGAIPVANVLFEAPRFAWTNEEDDIPVRAIVLEVLAGSKGDDLLNGIFDDVGMIFEDIRFLNFLSVIQATLSPVFPVCELEVLLKMINDFKKSPVIQKSDMGDENINE
ncbi:hypothetical protein HN784_03720 [bacterium]|jgi:hypothetical protein|nr:hypothetical protein [bacterium]MBT4251104.1 hypothetical protein [bacterium]MBT4598104.1 hypothetical protein [bacterium]MBT6753446.1 hypothetical protein [bacterium]MBT7038159.1 hypothetical protein [bacterium]